MNEFVGRGPELDKIGTLLLGSARLVTLVGSGGIGKTRLADEAARRFQRARRNPVHWVRLARLAKGAGIAEIEEQVAQSVVDADFSGRSAWDAIVDTLSDAGRGSRASHPVLVMDNCEHVLAGAGRLIAELLVEIPELTILATSREPIGWVDEQLLAVPPLTQEQALTLFRQRAELTGHSIAADQIATTNRICRHVHNHPLHVRLAAARLLRQPLTMILADLSGAEDDRRMEWSHGPRVGAEPRHQGVRDVIAWSYDLCEDKERLLLERMSVFAAGYDTNPEDDRGYFGVDVGTDLEAIELVCADDPAPAGPGGVDVGLARDEVEALLGRLADQSLVTVHLTANTVRYSLLESIRLFAQQRLEERSTGGTDEYARVAGRHRRYYRDKVGHAQATWFSSAEQDLLDWARAAWDNILIAIEGSITTPGEAAVGLEISAGLISLRAPFFNSSLREMRRWTERTLAATRVLTPQPVELQVAAVALIGWITLCQGQHDDAEQMLEDCVAVCIPDPAQREHWRQTLDNDIGLPAPVEFVWGAELLMVQSDPRAITVLARAREKFRELGDLGGAAMSGLFEAFAAAFLGPGPESLATVRGFLDDVAASGARWLESWAELAWAIALTKHGDPTAALAVGRTAMAHQLNIRDQWGTVLAVHIRLWSVAQIITDLTAAGNADPKRLRALATETARLAGGARTLRVELGVNIKELGPFADETDNAIDVARGVLGDTAFAAADREGSLLRPELGEVQKMALGVLSIDRMPRNHPARTFTQSNWDDLTSVEQDVATLAAAGWTNTAIAARRGNSSRTVDAHVAAILQKLVITSRQDIIRYVPQHRIGEVRTEAARRPHRAGEKS